MRENLERKNNRVAVFAAGSFGSSMAGLCSDLGHEVIVYTRSKEQSEYLKEYRDNPKYLKDFNFSKDVIFTSSLEETFTGAKWGIIAVSAQNMRSFLNEAKPFIDDDINMISLAKGLEMESNLRMSEIYDEIIGLNNFCVLSGPSHAEEIAQKLPTTVVTSSKKRGLAQQTQEFLTGKYLRIYTNDDILGVELGGSLKNIIALGAGVIQGMGFKDNTKAALMTRGMHEITRLGVKLGANRETFYGLSGMGDLIVTCTSMNSRNLRYGLLLGEGKNMEEAFKEINMVVEGVYTCKAAYDLSQKLNVSMPITQGIYKLLYEKARPEDIMESLMDRENKPETLN